MNATKNLYEVYSQIEGLARQDDVFLQETYREILHRVKDLEEIVDLVTEDGISDKNSALLDSSYFAVEEDDKNFIKNCAHAIAEKRVEEHEITRLLMINRTITQSLRMVLLSMQGLMSEEDTSEASLKDAMRSE